MAQPQGHHFTPYTQQPRANGPSQMPYYQLPPANIMMPESQQYTPQQPAFRRVSELCVTCGGIRHTAKTCPINIRARKETIVRVADELGAIIKEEYEIFRNTKFLGKLEELLECHAHRCYYHTSPLLTLKKTEKPKPSAENESTGRIE